MSYFERFRDQIVHPHTHIDLRSCFGILSRQARNKINVVFEDTHLFGYSQNKINLSCLGIRGHLEFSMSYHIILSMNSLSKWTYHYEFLCPHTLSASYPIQEVPGNFAISKFQAFVGSPPIPKGWGISFALKFARNYELPTWWQKARRLVLHWNLHANRSSPPHSDKTK